MKKLNILFLTIITITIAACKGDNANDDLTNIDSDYKQKMRTFVQEISKYAKSIDNEFIIIPQNGPELVTVDGNEDGAPQTEYLSAIDGVGREDLFYGFDNDNVATLTAESDYMIAFLDICEQNGVEVLTTDYCWDHSKMDDSYSKNNTKAYISFAAPDRELNLIPDYPATPYNENSNDINTLHDAKNFLYLLNSENYTSKQEFITAINGTNYDVIIMDLLFNESGFTSTEINQLKLKNNGGKRLVIAYMSIGEAENYRYYWNDSWTVGSPSWIEAENPDWAGNFKVRYWESEWQTIVYGNNDSYLKKIIDAGFNGVYLDIIDAFEYFE
jgi:cysteinyl-tRNA synthetase, unknown class